MRPLVSVALWTSVIELLLVNASKIRISSFSLAEVDLDAPALSLAHDANARAEQKLQFLFGGARVDVGRCRGLTRRDEGPPTWCAFEHRLDERFGFAHRRARAS